MPNNDQYQLIAPEVDNIEDSLNELTIRCIDLTSEEIDGLNLLLLKISKLSPKYYPNLLRLIKLIERGVGDY